MVINHNIGALNTYNKLTANTKAATESLQKLSSGLRINKAGDDAAGLAISQKMQAQINGLDQAARNAQDGISLVQTAEGALSETQSILQRMATLVNEGATGTLQASDQASIKAEIASLNSELDRISQSTTFNGIALLDGTLNATIQIGASSGVQDQLLITIGATAFDSTGLGVDGLSTTIDSSSIDTVNSAISMVSTARAALGAYQNRLEHTINNLSTMSQNLSAASSQITDVDMAKEMTEFTKFNILTQAAQAMLAQANQLPQGVLSLLK